MIFQISMYYLAFTPLWITVILKDGFSIWDHHSSLGTECISIVAIIACFLGAFGCVCRNLNSKNEDNTQKYTVMNVEEDKFSIVEFLMSYTLPLSAFDFTEYREVLCFFIFFLIFGWVCYKHSHFCVNIILVIMKYKIFNCEIKNSDGIEIKKKVVSKRHLKQCRGQNLDGKYLNNEYILDCHVVTDQSIQNCS